MKLSPPASSSDIEVAREIARRLHQRRRREDRPGDRAAAPPPATHVPQRAAPPRAAAPHVPPSPPAERAHPAARPVPPPPPAAPERSHPAPSWADEPAPPSWDSIPVDLPGDSADDRGNTEPEDALDALTAPTLDAAAEPASAAEAELDEEAVPQAPNLGPDTFDEADAYGGAPQPSPFDEAGALGTPGLDEPELATSDLESRDLEGDGSQPGLLDSRGFAGIGSEGGLPEEPAEEEELFDDRPGPSWGDVVEGCMSLAHARGALLADATGELVAARGEWPDPGADAIASRLVAMMDRTLKDAPTRSVSAPVGGLHLTAWRVPVGDRLLTAAFIADSPVRAETRPSIDLEVQRGAAA
jgi:hypothetical protein